ncbi:hypothetical protein Tco_0069828 [Tanacetum coccineum]
MCTYMKNMTGYKMEHFKGKIFYEFKEMFDNVYKQVTSFVPMDSVMGKEGTKRAGLNLQEEMEEVYAEALQVKYPIIDWEVYSKDTRRIWLRRGSVQQSLQMIKRRHYGFSTIEPTDDTLWKLQRYMHDPLEWRLYDTCGVHHVSLVRGYEIFMLVEKEYPLTKGLMTVMLSNKL